MPAMPQRSAGILLYRRAADTVEVLLVHSGGPFFARKDLGAWSIPKGMIEPGETPLAAARREFSEETGMLPEGEAALLGDFRYTSGKIVTAYAVEGDFDVAGLVSATFTLAWPRRGKTPPKPVTFPEVDRAEWFSLADAAERIVAGQRPMLAALAGHLGLP
jgi:predicted NUDIX family NTP pyrophosphohydrolase